MNIGSKTWWSGVAVSMALLAYTSACSLTESQEVKLSKHYPSVTAWPVDVVTDGEAADTLSAVSDADTLPVGDTLVSDDSVENTGPDVTVPPAPPAYPHLDMVVDTTRGTVKAWAHLIHVEWNEGMPSFHHVGYADTSDEADYWPASTIKVYPATAALVLMKSYGLSLDAKATFYHQSQGNWVKDTTRSIRDLIHGSFNCSSNLDYTLLLRLAGIDWLSTDFFTEAHGFSKTTLMSGYVSNRPGVYKRSEAQRIVLEEGDVTITREHQWSGTKYAHAVGCKVFYASDAANCSSPRDMAEHFRRLMFHEYLDAGSTFDVRSEDLDWMRYLGGVMNNTASCGGPGWAGVAEVLPDADFYHKGGKVSGYRLDLQYVEDSVSDTRYIVAIATDTGQDLPVERLSEAFARMTLNPDFYIHLDNLKDQVNPVVGDLTVYAVQPAVLQLIVKDSSEDPYDPAGWSPLPGSAKPIPEGISNHMVVSNCLLTSEKVHIRGQILVDDTPVATSDLHYVIVDAEKPCSD